MKLRKSRTAKMLVAMVFAMATALVSCDDTTVYNRYVHTPIAGWERNDTLFFQPLKVETAGIYAESLGLRVNGSYPFQRISLVVEHRVYPSNVILTDTLDCLIVGRDGSTEGRGVGFFQYDFPLPSKRYSSGDSVIVTVRHNMKREILPGIADIGVCVKRNF